MSKLPSMKSMELDDEDKIDAFLPIPCAKPDFPFGLRGHLTDKELAKLDLDPHSAEVGDCFHMRVLARITNVRHTDESTTGKTSRIEFQIEEIAVDCDEENEDED